jgi:hypothetical protein
MPSVGVRRGPGIVQPNGDLLTADSITLHIANTIARAAVLRATKDLGAGWMLVKKPGLVITPLAPPAVIAHELTCNDVPDHLVIRPGDPEWVDWAVVERAIAAHLQLQQTAPSRAEGVKGEVAVKQTKRIALAPSRKKPNSS